MTTILTMLYHREIAPKGKTFEESPIPFKQLREEGWVDHPAMIDINPGGMSKAEISNISHHYSSGEIPGIGEFDKELGKPRCPIWKTVVFDYPPVTYSGYINIDSPRAGGEYAINNHVINALRRCNESCKVRLTTWMVKQRRLGNECPKITESIIENMEQNADLEIYERSNLLLQFISSRTPKIGDEFSFSNQRVSALTIAWSASTNFSEVQVLLGYLVDQKYLQKITTNFDKYRLTVSGIAKLEELTD